MTERRVVITGLGLLTSVGLNVPDSWQAIIQGQSGISKIKAFEVADSACKIASSLNLPLDFDVDEFTGVNNLRKMDPFIHYGAIAAKEAIEDSGWLPSSDEMRQRTGVILGSGIGGLRTIEETAIKLYEGASKKVTPYFIPASLINLLSGIISIKYGYQGPNLAAVTACSTGANAIGDAARVIKYGDADVMIAGGAEAPITPLGLAGFTSLKALSTKYNDEPISASRPWDMDRDGFVMGEGAGVVVLEEYNHAIARGAKIYGELAGYGLSSDANHITAPHPEGKGAYRAMYNALSDANLRTDQINYVNAHGTSTGLGDLAELEAVQRLFLRDNPGILMSSTKSSIGHLLGASGSVELIFTLLAMRDSIAPPTLNLYNIVPEAKIDLIPLKAREVKITTAMSNSFGFGGTNASLIVKKI